MEDKLKILTAYYSRRGNNYTSGGIVNLAVGNTEIAAKAIQKLIGGDAFRIDTVKEYPADYEKTTQVAQAELRQGARPEIKGRVDDMSGYDVVFLGYPNWWGTMPMAIFTFLEGYDFTGKTILPFCTNEGSGLGHSESDIKKLCPKAKVQKGLAIRGTAVKDAEGDIADWIAASGIKAERHS
jgi:flavodoxin